MQRKTTGDIWANACSSRYYYYLSHPVHCGSKLPSPCSSRYYYDLSHHESHNPVHTSTCSSRYYYDLSHHPSWTPQYSCPCSSRYYYDLSHQTFCNLHTQCDLEVYSVWKKWINQRRSTFIQSIFSILMHRKANRIPQTNYTLPPKKTILKQTLRNDQTKGRTQ